MLNRSEIVATCLTGLLREMTNFRTGQEIYKKHIKHLVVPENKKMFNKTRKTI